jgi:hypothetical protein
METVLYEYEATHHKIMIFWMQQSAQDHFLWIVMLVTATNYHKLSKYSTILLLALASSSTS